MKLVTRDNLKTMVDAICLESLISFDTETTGIRPYHGSVMFSLIVYSGKESYYFNFQDYPAENIEAHLTIDDSRQELQRIFSHRDKTYIAHNIKFDMAILAVHDIEVKGKLYDTMVMERVLNNEVNGFSLDATAKRYGYEKDDAPSDYIKQHPDECTDSVQEKYRRSETKILKYWKVPFEIIAPYGCQDAKVTYEIYVKQLDACAGMDVYPMSPRKTRTVITNEEKLLRTVYDMESKGVRLDIPYCDAALSHDQGMHDGLVHRFQETTGMKYEETIPTLSEVFKDEKVVKTYKSGQRSFEAYVLQDYSHPMAQVVLDIRKYKNKIDAFMSMLYAVDSDGILHTQFNQHIPWTGRFSSSNPNMQNMKKDSDDGDPFPVRRAIIPREGKIFYMLDYDQMEYRLMLEYAREMKIIEQVLAGTDVHQATADLVGIERKMAKTANFAILYGAGDKTLAKQTGISKDEAKELRESIFDAAPELEHFIKQVRAVVYRKGFITNWLGRRYNFSDKKFAYKAINTLIQGGAADVIKVAMNDCHALPSSGMLMTIHDELVFEVPHDQDIDVCKEKMEQAFPHKLLPLTVSIEHSYKSLADKVEGYAAGNSVQDTSVTRP